MIDERDQRRKQKSFYDWYPIHESQTTDESIDGELRGSKVYET